MLMVSSIACVYLSTKTSNEDIFIEYTVVFDAENLKEDVVQELENNMINMVEKENGKVTKVRSGDVLNIYSVYSKESVMIKLNKKYFIYTLNVPIHGGEL